MNRFVDRDMFMRYFGDAPGHYRRKGRNARRNEPAPQAGEPADEDDDAEPDDELCARVWRVRERRAELSDDELEDYGYELSDEESSDGEEVVRTSEGLQDVDMEMLNQFNAYDGVDRDAQGSGQTGGDEDGGEADGEDDAMDEDDDERRTSDSDDEAGPDELEYAAAGFSV